MVLVEWQGERGLLTDFDAIQLCNANEAASDPQTTTCGAFSLIQVPTHYYCHESRRFIRLWASASACSTGVTPCLLMSRSFARAVWTS